MIVQRIAAIAAVTCMIAACASSATEEATGDVVPMDTAVTRTDTAGTPPSASRTDSAAYPTRDTTQSQYPQTPANPSAAGTGARWTATLSATPAAMNDTTVGTSISGNATVSAGDMSGSTKAEITVSGLRSGQTYPWHVHSGSCATDGPIVGPADAYKPLTASMGSTTATATIPIATPSSGQYHVNIHKSPTEPGVIIACGDLKSGSGM
ncbi:MAG: CHRD domain-containing protein [Gemmatimonadaceae bacterium]